MPDCIASNTPRSNDRWVTESSVVRTVWLA
jgi:hypothetical protein